jgi:hypothetical protein
MSRAALFLMVLGQLVMAGGIFLIYPRIVRKGLLFGVYVGEETFAGEAARAITRAWYQGMWATLAACVAAGALLAAVTAHPLAVVGPVGLLLIGFVALYLRAYRYACALAPQGAPPAAVAPLVATPTPSPILPALAVAAGIACGAFAIGNVWTHYGELPARVPSHFGFSGEPDAWLAKSPLGVMLPALLTLVVGVGLGVMSWLVSHAKRALRAADRGASLAAQMRFRTAMTRFLAGVSLLTTALLTWLSVSMVRVGLGLAPGLGKVPMVLVALLLAFGVGGTILIAFRYGQGGARLEQAAGTAPLTNGLADNRHWVLGMFYVNRDDPSIMVERRFGFGYTVNFGNPKAVLLLCAFLAAVLGLTIVALVTS